MSKIIRFTILIFIITGTIIYNPPEIKIIGSMRATLREGKLKAVIQIDSISKPGIFGVGPLDSLSGEILLYNGKSYVSTIESGDLAVKEDRLAKAPFFVYAEVKSWKEIDLKDSFKNLRELEDVLEKVVQKNGLNLGQPIVFQLNGKFMKATFHTLNNLQNNYSPSVDHKNNQSSISLENIRITILGFYSRHHQGIFTHHDSYVHMHLLDDTKTNMGHVDQLESDGEQFSLLIAEK